jgi:glucan phosphoethanolaminetransferase (alkaline phosphatase superfamily)
MIAGIILASYMRIWLGVILLLPVLIFPIMRIKKPILKILTLFLILAALLAFVLMFIKYFRIDSVKELLFRGNSFVESFSRGGSTLNTDKIFFTSIWSIILYIPFGVFTALFRPLPGEVNNAFGFLAGMEGALLLILFVIAMKRMKWRELADPLVIWAVSLVVIWSAAYGFVSYNLGTMGRYRLQILPVFLGLLLYFSRDRSREVK